ncbi:MAG: thioredoxin fold domain-containing protein [Balneolaceae bacterium]
MNSTHVLKFNSKDSRLSGLPLRALFRSLTMGFIILTLSLSVAFAQEKTADDLRIQWTGMERALELAAENNKTILIDVYAEWCSYCQRMQDEVYPDLEVRQIIREYFIPVRVNVDSKQTLKYLDRSFTQEEFSRALENRSTPTYYFMNEKGEVVGRQPGYMPADVFSSLLEFVGSGAYRTQTYDEFNMN